MRRFLTLFVLSPLPASAASTWSIGTGEGADFATAQQALAVAQDGDVLQFSEGDHDVVRIDGDRILALVGDPEAPETVRLAGLVIQGAGTQVDASGFRLSGAVGAVEVSEGHLSLDTTLITDGGGENGFALWVHSGGSAAAHDLQITRIQGGDGAVVVASGAALELFDSEIRYCTGRDGAAVHAREGAAIHLDNVDLSDNDAAGDGGAVAIYDAAAVLSQVRMDRNSAERGGAIGLFGNGSLNANDLDMDGNIAVDGGGFYMAGGTAELVRTQVGGSMAATGAVLSIEDGLAQVSNALWARQEGADTGGAVYMSGGELAMASSVLYANSAEIGGGLAMSGGDATLEGVIISHTSGEALANTGTGSLQFDRGLLYANGANTAGSVDLGPDVVRMDPEYVDAMGGDFAMWATSPALDSGLLGAMDADGTAADMGIYGGPLAWLLEDADGDGFVYGRDCNDEDANVHEAAGDSWYDGVDSNCDRRNDYDQDGDGYEAAQLGGTDCHDLRDDIHPGSEERTGDDLDSDCDGILDVDADGDGWGETLDCDDQNPDAAPDAEERWYDGVDSDCDQADDFDQDRDGHAASAYGGTDCNDTDPFVNPDMPETADDRVDQDCDGADLQSDAGQPSTGENLPGEQVEAQWEADAAPGSMGGSTGCSTAGDVSKLGWLGGLVALGAMVRRRED